MVGGVGGEAAHGQKVRGKKNPGSDRSVRSRVSRTFGALSRLSLTPMLPRAISLSPSLSRSLSNLIPRETLAGLRSSGKDH